MRNLVSQNTPPELARYRARKWIEIGLAWEASASKDVWILTTCRARHCYLTYEDAREAWNSILTREHGRCDFFSMEKYCQGGHTLLVRTDELPLSAFHKQLFLREVLDCQHDPVLKCLHDQYYQDVLRPPVLDLPPWDVQPSGVPIPGVVYIIHAVDTYFYKIGRSVAAKTRLDVFQTASPFKLELHREIPTDDTVALERAWHQRYASYRIQGEWFRIPPEVAWTLYEEETASLS